MLISDLVTKLQTITNSNNDIYSKAAESTLLFFLKTIKVTLMVYIKYVEKYNTLLY